MISRRRIHFPPEVPVSDTGRRSEDDWFRANEKKLLEEARRAREAREADRKAHEDKSERERLKALHYLKCPKCGHDMKVETFQGVEIERCTSCEGFFMDAGEIEQLYLTKDQSKRIGFLKSLLGI
jgi:hypothetical protein